MLDRTLNKSLPKFQPSRLVNSRSPSPLLTAIGRHRGSVTLGRNTPSALLTMRPSGNIRINLRALNAASGRLPEPVASTESTSLPEPASPTSPARKRTRGAQWESGDGFSALARSSSILSAASDSSSSGSYRTKHLNRVWDNFWANHINAPSDFARRHIVMTKAYKNCIAEMHEYVESASDPDLKTRLCKLYADKLNEYKGTNSYSETDDLIKLETDLFHTLHNLRFNIFLGDSAWNSAVSDCATILQNNEEEALTAIENAEDHEQLDKTIQSWFDTAVDFSKTFRIPRYDQARQDLRETIRSITIPSTPIVHEPLEERKSLLKGLLMSFYDSLTCDISEASHTPLRQWQNKVLPALHGQFLDLQKDPDLDQYEKTLNTFLSIDKAGASILGINLADLDATSPVPESLALFQGAITAPIPPS